MLDFVMKVVFEVYSVGDVDIVVLGVYGFSEEDVWDIVVIVVFFVMFNCFVNVSNMWLNDEFYMFGCVEK